MFAYVDDVAAWEPWQREYRYGAFYVFPPVGVIDAVDALREIHDPVSAATCRAHISLTAPVPGPIDEPQFAEMADCLAFAPFEVAYGPLRTFLPHPGVVYDVGPQETLRALRQALHATSGFQDLAPLRSAVRFHMTVAEFISPERTIELLNALAGNVPIGVFNCDAVEYAVPDERFRFERVAVLPLGPPPDRSSPP